MWPRDPSCKGPIMHVCNANWKLSVSDNVQRPDIYKLLEKNIHQLCIPLQHLFLVSNKLLVLFILPYMVTMLMHFNHNLKWRVPSLFSLITTVELKVRRCLIKETKIGRLSFIHIHIWQNSWTEIIWSFTHEEKRLHSLQYEESRFLYFTNTCIINYHEL